MPKLLHVSDLHFGAEDRFALGAVEAFAREEHVEGLIVSGDLTMRGKPSEFDAAAAWLSRFPMPVVATPGNHDTSYLNLAKRAWRPFRRYDRLLEPVAGFSLQTAHVFVATLNTARGLQARPNWALGAVSRSQIRRLEETFRDAPERLLRVVVCHHPLIGPPDNPLSGSTRNGWRAAAAMAEMGVDLVMTGHLHVPFVMPLPVGDGATWSIGAGTLSERQRGHPASFTVLRLQGPEPTSQAYFIDERGEITHTHERTLCFRRRNAQEPEALNQA